MNTAKKQKPQTPKPTSTPKSTPKTQTKALPSQPTPQPQSKLPTTTPKTPISATVITAATPKSAPSTPTTPTVLKSILKKPKPLTDTPAKIPAQPAKTATLKQSVNKQATATKTPGTAQSQKKPSPKSTLRGNNSPYPKQSIKGSPFPQSIGVKKMKSVQKLPQFDEQDGESDDEEDDDDVDIGAFNLGSDEEDDDDEGGFDVESQIARALSTKPNPKSAAQKPAAKIKPPPKVVPSKAKQAPKPAVPQLSESDEDEDVDSEEDTPAPSQAKNWKALASKTLTGKEPITKAPTIKPTPSSDDLGSGLPSVPRPQKKGEEKQSKKAIEAAKKPLAEKTVSALPAKKTKLEEKKVEQAAKKGKEEQKKGAVVKKAEPAKKVVQMFDDSDDETALDFDGGEEGDEGDEDEQEATILRALRKKGDFSDLVRPKGSFLDEEEEGDEGEEGDDEAGDSSDDYENEELPIEKAAKRLAAMEKRVEKEANAEMQTNMQEVQTFQLPSGQEIEQEKLIAPDLTLLNQRIQDVLFTLADFRKKKEPDRSRTEYMERLAQDLTTYYGYLPELIDRFLEMFSPAEAVEFLMANEAQRPVTLRINSLKTRRGDLIQSLSKRGIHVEPLADWTKVGCKVTMSKLPLGATPEYMAGHYVLQSAASFLPVMALAPQEHERVLDMCASPGGKATYIAALMKNTGLLVANDANTKRLPSLTGNIHRLGVRNSVVTNFDGRKLKKHFGLFDRILLDAPCSGLGVISKDPSVKTTKTNKDIQRCSHIQKELALAAIDMLDADSKTGGYLVYSTCSISVEENEEVVDYLLSHRHVKLVETNIPFGVVGMTRYRTKQFHPSVALARRFYPHVHNMDGFFVCKLKKLSDGAKTVVGEQPEKEEELPPLVEEEVKRKKPKKNADKAPSPTTIAEKSPPVAIASVAVPVNTSANIKKAKKIKVAATPAPVPVVVPAAAKVPTKSESASAASSPGGVKRKTDKAKSVESPVGQSKKQKLVPPSSAISPNPKSNEKPQKSAIASAPVQVKVPKKKKATKG